MNLYLNADCMNPETGLPSYPDNYFDLAIVDPPYGNIDAIGLADNKKQGRQAAPRSAYKLFNNVQPNDDYFIELVRVSKNQIVWGGNYLGLCGGAIVWQKNGTAFGEAEIAICSTHNSVKIFEFTWNGMIQGNMKDKESRLHPTQKPMALYRWLVKNYAKHGDKILDTHVGSASSLVVFEEMGFEYVGFELDADYYRDSCKRLEAFRAQPKLFTGSEIFEASKPPTLF